MRITFIIFFLYCFKFYFGQTLQNWYRNKTDISIDQSYLLKDTFVYNDTKFNYKRAYKDKNFIEYGNVDANHKASGNWVILNKYTPVLKGTAENGFKINQWTAQNCVAEGSFYIYKWNDDKTKTYVDSIYEKRHRTPRPSAKRPSTLRAK